MMTFSMLFSSNSKADLNVSVPQQHGLARHTRSIIPIAAAARAAGYTRLIVPETDAAEAALVPNLTGSETIQPPHLAKALHASQPSQVVGDRVK